MRTWTDQERRTFDESMSSYWTGWARVSSGRRVAYVDLLERYRLPIVQAAMLSLVKSQESDRVPLPSVLAAEARAEDRRAFERFRARAKTDGGLYASRLERDLAVLVEHCVEIQDAKGARWRFLAEGLCCEGTNTLFPWTAAKPGQMERLARKGLEVLGPGERGRLLTAEQFSREEDYWGPRVNDPNPKKAAWWRRQRAGMVGGKLPTILEAARDGVPEREFEESEQGPEEDGFTQEPEEASGEVPF